MGDVIDQLLARGDVGTGAPAPESVIQAVAQFFPLRLPEPLVRLWRASDGVTLEPLDAYVLGGTEVLEFCRAEWTAPMAARGLLPVVGSGSDFLCVIARAPLACRVAYVPHDDGSRLLYRDFASCVAGLLGAMDGDDPEGFTLSEAEGDYTPDAPRTEQDREAARALLRTPGEDEEEAWNYAAQLLDDSDLPAWEMLLETDHFVRRDVRERMRAMSSPAIRELLLRDEAAFEAFAALAADEARRAGLEVGARQGTALRVGGKWFELETFFHRRTIPDAVPRMIAWWQDVVAGRNPNHRPGNYMLD